MRLERVVAQHSRPQLKKIAARVFIDEGKVAVNGEVIREKGWQVFVGNGGDACDKVVVNGKALAIPRGPALFLLNKPKGVLGVLDRKHARERRKEELTPARDKGSAAAAVAAAASAEGSLASHAATLGDLVPLDWLTNDLGCFGRLDKNSSGLVLLGKDGGLGSLLLHPAKHVEKQYIVDLAHNAPLSMCGGDGLVPDACSLFARGLKLKDGTLCAPAKLEFMATLGKCTCVERVRKRRRAATREGGGGDADSGSGGGVGGGGGDGGGGGGTAHYTNGGNSSDDEPCPALTRISVRLSEGKFHQGE